MDFHAQRKKLYNRQIPHSAIHLRDGSGASGIDYEMSIVGEILMEIKRKQKNT